jgi:hypothetical protein
MTYIYRASEPKYFLESCKTLDAHTTYDSLIQRFNYLYYVGRRFEPEARGCKIRNFQACFYSTAISLFDKQMEFFSKDGLVAVEFCGLGFSLRGSHENGLFFYALQEGTPTALRIYSSN